MLIKSIGVVLFIFGVILSLTSFTITGASIGVGNKITISYLTIVFIFIGIAMMIEESFESRLRAYKKKLEKAEKRKISYKEVHKRYFSS